MDIKKLSSELYHPILYNMQITFAVKHVLLCILSMSHSKTGYPGLETINEISKTLSSSYTFDTPFGVYRSASVDGRRRIRPSYEQEIRTIILSNHQEKMKNRKDVVINIGANTGRRTIELAKMGYTVIAFEPQLELFNSLMENAELSNVSNKVVAHNYAIGNSSQKSFMNVFHFHQGASSIEGIPTIYPKTVASEEGIYIRPLDSFPDVLCMHKNIGTFIIDVEGYELEVMKGMSTLLQVMNLEDVDFFIELSHAGERINELLNIFDTMGFDGRNIDNAGNWHFAISELEGDVLQ